MSIQQIYIVHHIHTDLGYTDFPTRARKLHAQFVGQAVEAVLDGRRRGVPYAWTCEALLSVSDWLAQATPEQTAAFYAAVDSGDLDITAIPFNVTPFLSAQEWEQMLHWMPESFRSRVPIRSAMQNDINGFPVQAAERLLDEGVHYLWMGPNIHLAAPPFTTPHAFRWKMPSGRTMFVWLNGHYNNGFYLFNDFWREGPIPAANDTCYRAPDALDIFKTDDASMQKSYETCRKCIAAFEGREPNAGEFVRDGFTFNKIEGVYPYSTLVVSLTNHWRMDNDPPIAHLGAFVKRWNDLGYTPKLKLATATQAMQQLELEAGDNADVVEGEWPDWWANGTMSIPREVSYARKALRRHQTAVSDLFGPMSDWDTARSEDVLKQMCIFNEHTYSGWQSISDPNSFEAIASTAELNLYAYRALNDAEALLADRYRRALANTEQRLCVANPTARSYSGWVTLPYNCLRGSYHSVKDLKTGRCYPLEPCSGGGAYSRPHSLEEMTDEYETTDYADKVSDRNVRFWVDSLPANAVSQFAPQAETCKTQIDAPLLRAVETDANGWPLDVRYCGFDESLIRPGFGDFTGVSLDTLAPRWVMIDLFDEKDPARREALHKKLTIRPAVYGSTVRTENDHEIVFTQPFSYNSLHWAKRILTLDRHTARARLCIRMRRADLAAPELYYLQTCVSDTRQLPTISNAGHAFVPGQEQIPNTCMDYYTSDGWVRYDKGETHWLVSSQDAPMLTFGQPNCFARLKELPKHMERPLFMLYDNTWDTNFIASESGRLCFRFDVCQTHEKPDCTAQAAAMALEPPVLVKMRDQI